MMKENRVCKKCGGISSWDSYFQSWICTRCGYMVPDIITKGDRIRAMTDDVDLAIFLDSVRTDGLYKDNKFPYTKFGWLDWLKSEAEAEEEENG